MPRRSSASTRKRTGARRNGDGRTGTGRAGAITPAPAERASPKERPARNRGHRSVEVSRHVRDRLPDGDACLARAGFAPGNDAPCTGIALALVIRRADSASAASATRRFALRRRDAFAAILSSRAPCLPPERR